MNLVQFLAAGVNGAASGSATFFLRGTASSAAAVLYNDFEGTTQPGTNVITLDANGAAEIYCDAYCDVEIKNSAGTTLRTVTIGHSAPLVEVRSDSFTGTAYSGGGDTPGLPITLAAVLDLWLDSAGAPDWQVMFNGSPTNIETIVAGIASAFINVKDPAYGAVGDGVTDDTTAILAAVTAASNGNIVFFPPGTYKLTTLSLTSVNVNWLGCGPGVSIISGSTGTAMVTLSDNTNTGYKNFAGLSFTSSGSYNRLFALQQDQNVYFRNCTFDASNCSTDAIERNDEVGFTTVGFTDCEFTFGALITACIRNTGDAGDSNWSIKGCDFVAPSGFNGRIIMGADFNVSGCRFDCSAVTSGTYYAIDAEDANTTGKYIGNFTGNKFLDGASSGFAFDLRSVTATSLFIEDDNTFSGFTAPADATEQGHIYDLSSAGTYTSTTVVRLGSRKGRALAFTNAASNVITDTHAQAIAETIVITHTNASILAIRVDEDFIPPNHDFSIVVLQQDASSRNVSVGDGIDTVTETSVVTNGRAFFGVRTYVGESSNVEMNVFFHGQAAN